jgi:hypothetical protein
VMGMGEGLAMPAISNLFAKCGPFFNNQMVYCDECKCAFGYRPFISQISCDVYACTCACHTLACLSRSSCLHVFTTIAHMLTGSSPDCVPRVVGVHRWVPRSNLSGSLSLAFTGGPVGIIAALLLAPPFLDAFGWESLFVVCGAMGLAWSAVWQPVIPDGPPQLQSQPQSAGA